MFSLDVSFNDLVDLETSLVWLCKLPLKMLSMEGNPLILTPGYRSSTIERLESIKILDGQTIIREPKEPVSAIQVMTPVSIPKIDPTFKLELAIRLLKNVEGTVLVADENCPFDAEKLEEIPDD